MTLKVIGSGSSGNGYAIVGDDEILLLEAGVSLDSVKKTIDYQISKVVGCLITHSHGDHAKYRTAYAGCGIPIITNKEYSTVIQLERPYSDIRGIPTDGKTIKLGGFAVAAFDCIHDVPCVGYLIKHEDMGTLLFVTDSEYVQYRFSGVNHILCECNYSQEVIDQNLNDGRIIKSLRDRIMHSHMSLETCRDLVKINSNPMLLNVVLLHLSSHNSDQNHFKNVIKGVSGTCHDIQIAKSGLEVNLNVTPF